MIHAAISRPNVLVPAFQIQADMSWVVRITSAILKLILNTFLVDSY